MTTHNQPAQATFTGAEGNILIADVFGRRGAPVLLLHGGGQTRHAWRNTAIAIARAGRVAYAVDQRGHGDSEWVESGAYGFPAFAADVRSLAGALTARSGEAPVMIGASLGGIAALLAEGQAAEAGTAPLFSALVLVDITPRVDRSGIAKIQAFMSAHAREGFATVADAADAVAAYLPHRPRPRSHEGLKKNLRLHADGRWRWHWDPRFIEGQRSVGGSRPEAEEKMVRAARRITQPALLVRGASSEIVQEAHAREFLELVPHAEYLDVGGAQHMVAGDRNDQFAAAILDFIARLDRRGASRADAASLRPGRLNGR
ncbi:MAG: alpha/beta fold hydrolase [Rhizobiales bacterium]|nr:alpha/beta fold hydrolase [Hyphomicrobiales bacterium]